MDDWDGQTWEYTGEPSACPTCSKKLDAASSPGKEPPKPGDVSLCLYCAEILTWDEDMQIVLHPEKDELMNDQYISATRLAILTMERSEQGAQTDA